MGSARGMRTILRDWRGVHSSSMTAFPWSALEPCTQISFATGLASGGRRPPSVNFTTHPHPLPWHSSDPFRSPKSRPFPPRWSRQTLLAKVIAVALANRHSSLDINTPNTPRTPASARSAVTLSPIRPPAYIERPASRSDLPQQGPSM